MCVMGALLVLLIEVAGGGDESLTLKLLCVFSSNVWLGLEGGVRADPSVWEPCPDGEWPMAVSLLLGV